MQGAELPSFRRAGITHRSFKWNCNLEDAYSELRDRYYRELAFRKANLKYPDFATYDARGKLVEDEPEQRKRERLACYFGLLSSYYADIDEMAEPDKNIKRLANFMTGDRPEWGFIMMGQCGNGKTSLLRAFLGQMRARKGSCLLVTSKQIVEYARTKGMDILKEEEYLLIDDLGNEPCEVNDYGNVVTPLIDIIEYRYDNRKFTGITTNLTPDQIEEKYGKRIRERLREMMYRMIFEHESYR